MRDPEFGPGDWVLVFENGREHWWSRFFRRGFRHCWAIRHDAGLWTMVNPTLAWLEVVAIDGGTQATLRDFVGGASAIVLVRGSRDWQRTRLPWLLSPFSCVEVCKALVGIRAPWVLTPWQLYRHARSKHGRERTEGTRSDLPEGATARTGPGHRRGEPAQARDGEGPDGQGLVALGAGDGRADGLAGLRDG